MNQSSERENVGEYSKKADAKNGSWEAKAQLGRRQIKSRDCPAALAHLTFLLSCSLPIVLHHSALFPHRHVFTLSSLHIFIPPPYLTFCPPQSFFFLLFLLYPYRLPCLAHTTHACTGLNLVWSIIQFPVSRGFPRTASV